MGALADEPGHCPRAPARSHGGEEQLRAALALRPDWAEAHSNLGAALMMQRRFGEAILHLERAIALDPTLPQAHTNLARALQYRDTGSPQ